MHVSPIKVIDTLQDIMIENNIAPFRKTALTASHLETATSKRPQSHRPFEFPKKSEFLKQFCKCLTQEI